nr:signal peptidase II [Simiduia agarivorans]
MMSKRILFGYAIAVLMIVLDQWTKWYATESLSYGVPVPVNAFLDWTLLHNPGAAFSFLSDQGGWQRWFFTAIALVVSLVLVVWIWRLPDDKKLESLALSLVLGGAIGNLIDRVQLGYVVDFISVHYQSYYWPAFNIADSAICVGVALLIVDMVFFTKKTPDEVERK